jgi:hypothetical protein
MTTEMNPFYYQYRRLSIYPAVWQVATDPAQSQAL